MKVIYGRIAVSSSYGGYVSGRMKSNLDMKAVSGRMTISPGYEGSLWKDDNLTWI
jgi:hypothetical protein